MSEFPAIAHVAVTVRDLEVSRPWYQGTDSSDEYSEFRLGLRAALGDWETKLNEMGIAHGGILTLTTAQG